MNSTVDQEDCVNCVYLHIIIMAAIIILPRNYTNAQTMNITGHSFSCSMGVLSGNKANTNYKKKRSLPTPCSIRSSATSRWQYLAATCRGVLFHLSFPVRTFIFLSGGSASNHCWTMSTRPLRAACRRLILDRLIW